MKNNILILRTIEFTIYLACLFILFYDFLLPKHISNSIYSFGIGKFVLIIFSILLITYYFFARKETEYIQTRFNSSHIKGFIFVILICVLTYLVTSHLGNDALNEMKNYVPKK
jgi:isoprenylcysteine carboxyl methyltransferase (ICMT) family protein YpbQ